MRTLVPFDARDPNSRLTPVLSADERRDFAAAMLHDVLDAVRDACGDPVILSTTELDSPFVDDPDSGTPFVDDPDSDTPFVDNPDSDTTVIVDDRPLSEAVEAHLSDAASGSNSSDDPRTAVVMSDLALATPDALQRAFETPQDGEIAAAPGLGGGTNVLVVRHPDFEPDYHGTSFRDHQAVADAIGAPFHPIDSFRLAVDVDGPEDLPEVLLHGQGRAADWLADAGFSVVVDDGRARVERDSDH